MKKRIAIWLASLAVAYLMVGCGEAPVETPVGGQENETEQGGAADEENAEGGANEQTTCLVIFDTAGGSTIEPQIVFLGETIQRPIDPIKASTSTHEDVFAGWYYEDKEWNFETDVVNGNVTLVAKWDEETYTGPFLPSD